MHILFLTDNFPPESNAPAVRTYEHATEWVKNGHDVTVITCTPNFPSGKVNSKYKNKLWQSEYMNGIRVVRIWTYIAANEGFWLRILDYLSYMVSSFLASFFIRKFDLLIATSPQFFTAVSGYLVSTIRQRPFVFEVRDLWPESIMAVGAITNSKIICFLEFLELFLYRRASMIISVTNSFKENLIRRGIEPNKISVITNGVNLDHFQSLPPREDLLEKYGLSGKFIIGYIGTHGMAQKLDTVVKAASILQLDYSYDDIHFIFVGDGAEKKKLVQLASEMRIHNITFFGTVKRNEVLDFWNLLDAGVVHLKREKAFKSVIPSKIFECMSTGTIILHGVEGESAKIVTENNVGLVFEPENAQDLVQKIITIRSDEALCQNFRIRGPITAHRYNRSVLAAKMEKLLIAMLELKD